MSDKKEIVKVDFNPPASLADVKEIMAVEMDGLEAEFERVKIPSGGGIAFEVPGEDPDNPSAEVEIVGVIVDHHNINALWLNAFDGASNPPVCSSMDGKQGIDANTGEVIDCASCPQNRYGSGNDGKGKACKNMHRVYVLRNGELFPLLITLPPTSIKPFSNFLLKRVVAKGKRSSEVLTKITLKKAQSSTGITYSQCQFKVVETLDEKTAENMNAYAQAIKSSTRKVAIESDYKDAAQGQAPF